MLKLSGPRGNSRAELGLQKAMTFSGREPEHGDDNHCTQRQAEVILPWEYNAVSNTSPSPTHASDGRHDRGSCIAVEQVYIQSSGSQKLRSGTMHKDAGDHLLIMSSPSWEEQEPMQNSAWSHFKRLTVLSKVLSTSSTPLNTFTQGGLVTGEF